MTWHPRNPALPIRVAMVGEIQPHASNEGTASLRRWSLPDAWLDLPARELKVLLEMVRVAHDSWVTDLTLGKLAARSGLSSAARLAPLFDGLVSHQILLWRTVEVSSTQDMSPPSRYLQMDLYDRPDGWAAANGDDHMPFVEPPASQAARPPCYVYFFRGQATGLIKIGRSIDPVIRAHTLGQSLGEDLDILATLEEGRETPSESVLHWRFQAYRTRHPHHAGVEWFQPGPELLAFIEACQAARPSGA